MFQSCNISVISHTLCKAHRNISVFNQTYHVVPVMWHASCSKMKFSLLWLSVLVRNYIHVILNNFSEWCKRLCCNIFFSCFICSCTNTSILLQFIVLEFTQFSSLQIKTTVKFSFRSNTFYIFCNIEFLWKIFGCKVKADQSNMHGLTLYAWLVNLNVIGLIWAQCKLNIVICS